MRFARLSLERYGRFADCQLNFRQGQPDLHIIYGANEAGKTTSLSAVADLLFGFPQRSPYNFLYDYTLLRVGAVLEEDGRTFQCRRKKGTSATLLGLDDAPTDEAPLLAMLRGQTRETFRHSFSLDQEALRSGGRAMLAASDDLGRALFAAGSGLTGVSDELKKLEAEADAIWGPQAAARRSFTQAQRELTENLRVIRDETLRPKTWSDARQASDRAAEALDAARKERDALQTELRSAERIRRLAPLARSRDEQLARIEALTDALDLGKAREDAAEATMLQADGAERAKFTAEQLLHDVLKRMRSVAVDPAVLAEGDEIDRLVAESGAGEKASRDVVRLEAEYDAAEKIIAGFRYEAGPNAAATPTRALATRLRDIAQRSGEVASAKVQIAESQSDLEERRRRALAKLEAAGTGQVDEALVAAVDAARALGDEVDARCEAAKRAADAAAQSITTALARLVPWVGTIEQLRQLPVVGPEEIETARDTLAGLAAEVRREEEEARRHDDEAAVVSLELANLASSPAVAPEEVAVAQQKRDGRWSPIREHVLDGKAVPDPAVAVAAFEASMAAVDQTTERRFAFADASSKLSILKQALRSHELKSEQALGRSADARRRSNELLSTWGERLSSLGLPVLDPTSLKGWQAEREAIEAAQTEAERLALETNDVTTRRDAARGALTRALGLPDAGETDPLLPVRATGEAKRKKVEQLAQQRQLAQAELDQVDSDGDALSRRADRIEGNARETGEAWVAALAEANLQLDVVTCGAILGLLDELRAATDSQVVLRRRIDSISRDARDYTSRIGALADKLGIPPADTAARLRSLRDGLTNARAASKVHEALTTEERRRSGEVGEANAQLRAADHALAPLLAETGATDRQALADIIERSRAKRAARAELAETERLIVADGDGFALHELISAIGSANPDEVAERVLSLGAKLSELNATVDQAATAHGEAKRAFESLEDGATSAPDAAADAEQAKAELEVLSEQYILKRAQVMTLRWAIEEYRERHQDPMLLRAGELFSTLTLGNYVALRVDNDGPVPRLLGLRDDGRTMVEVQHMSEGTTDQLFLALRLAALEQSVRAGVNLPFLADDLFVNFDDGRAEAGFKVLAEVACSTQVLFFTHHPHLTAIAKSVVGAELHSECALA